jgi:predicted AlkP superfamily pyrophosphatase or phosphodiesterase
MARRRTPRATSWRKPGSTSGASGCLGLALAAVWLGCAPAAAPPPTQAPGPAPAAAGPPSLVVVSVAGLVPGRYSGPSPSMPTLAARAAAGVSAQAVRGVAPATSYPAHATLVTGRRPAAHGIVADRLLDARGVRAARYAEASQVMGVTLWQRAAQAGLRVAALGWPSTVGADITWNLPDVLPARRDETWFEALSRVGTPGAVELLRQAGGAVPAAQVPGSARDVALLVVACRLLSGPNPPRLLLLHLSQTATELAARGADAPETRESFSGVDRGLFGLNECVEGAGRANSTTFAVVGDHGAMHVHSVVSPNVALEAAGLITPARSGSGLASWASIARSNGGSAFVYARQRQDALLARHALEQAARETGAFRVVSAEEMLRVGADPDAWFGLEAEPGFLFSDSLRPPILRAAAGRGSWGYLPERAEMDSGLVAWGPGVRPRVRIPEMRLVDVAPTFSRVLGLELEGADGRVLVGALASPGVAAPAPAQAQP